MRSARPLLEQYSANEPLAGEAGGAGEAGYHLRRLRAQGCYCWGLLGSPLPVTLGPAGFSAASYHSPLSVTAVLGSLLHGTAGPNCGLCFASPHNVRIFSVLNCYYRWCFGYFHLFIVLLLLLLLFFLLFSFLS